ncbi:nucleoside-diphosphate-sugar epimerase [Limimaricola soesokkakensis]|uniref:Nucleoside-diphosphate-sugar epimerase n=1 Tax=Limimaricola soesokkakensis TaxID=1343159 RepID=A0A1X6ZMV2_9RHOB|nr:D-erythronate dehydrogenase [Limimaricola soesokkakensis]PSK85841.1 nucleoside-diphosphate-sugar epimerase [Limimaricola soesokkakensis]SLN56391.1 putative epimerase/dehydratase [Limimaricola soesokkakensis]
MNILIIGGGGFLGQKLARRLIARGELRGRQIAGLTLADIAAPAPLDAPFDIACTACDITDRAAMDALLAPGFDAVFLLAAVVSSHAEAEFEDGMNVNLHGVLNVLESLRLQGRAPVLVFTSSLAVFGGEVPDPIRDWTIPNPQTSYGTQKAIGELLVNDYSRRGFVDGRTLRLPTISVRPGRPNRAASSFMSSIIREPLNGEEAVCPVDPEFPHYYLSPRLCVENLIRGAEIEAADLGQSRTMTMPGRTLTIRQMIEAMTAVAGPEPAKLIRFEDDPAIRDIVSGWRFDYDPAKALALGLEADASFEENVRYYLEDDRPT